jgi:hypothetical protein
MTAEESFSQRLMQTRCTLRSASWRRSSCAVTELCGPEQARLSAEDWLDESELIDSPPRPQVGIGERSRSRPRLDWQIGSPSQ